MLATCICEPTIQYKFDTTTVGLYKSKVPLFVSGLVKSFPNFITGFNIQHFLFHSILISFIVINVPSVRDPFTASSPTLSNGFGTWKAGHDGCVNSPILHLPVMRPFPQPRATPVHLPTRSLLPAQRLISSNSKSLPLLSQGGLSCLLPRIYFEDVHLLTVPQCHSTGSSRVCDSRALRRR